MKLVYDIFTDNGGRPVNEDSASAFSRDGAYLFVVCDGLGGHGKGDAASQLVVRELGAYFCRCESTADFEENALRIVHERLLEEQKATGSENKMKTTAVALLVNGRQASLIHIGDSRGYMFRNGEVYSRTVDQSVPQMLVDFGEIEEYEIRNHPDRNRLIYAVGGELKGNEARVSRFELDEGDCFLLCTDGFWELVTEFEMTAFLRIDDNPEQWLSDMAKLAAKNGAGKEMDNYTAVAVMIRGV